MDKDTLIRKIRELKKREIEIRTEYGQMPKRQFALVWDTFFTEKGTYSLETLSRMSAFDRKTVFEDFFFSVYIKHYKELGLPVSNLFDPSLLRMFGLPQGATKQDVKERFRILAQKYHPDKGGDIDVFRTYLEIYEKLKSD
jgi:hypothetical protein